MGCWLVCRFVLTCGLLVGLLCFGTGVVVIVLCLLYDLALVVGIVFVCGVSLGSWVSLCFIYLLVVG